VVLAGILFGISFQIKFINVVLLPLVVLIVWLQGRCGSRFKVQSSRFGMTLARGTEYIPKHPHGTASSRPNQFVDVNESEEFGCAETKAVARV